MKLIYIFLSLILVGCCSSKKVTTESKSLETLKQEISLKVDSLSVKLKEIRVLNQLANQFDTISTDFEINFLPSDTGNVIINTPTGDYSLEKKGNGKVHFSGKTKTTQKAESEKTENSNLEKSESNLQKGINQKEEQQSQSETEKKEVEKTSWFRSWWLWSAIIVIGLITFLRWYLKLF